MSSVNVRDTIENRQKLLKFITDAINGWPEPTADTTLEGSYFAGMEDNTPELTTNRTFRPVGSRTCIIRLVKKGKRAEDTW